MAAIETRRSSSSSSAGKVHANLTPLIDVTFLLIVFFVLVAQITNSQIVDEIDLPEPDEAVSIEPEVNRAFEKPRDHARSPRRPPDAVRPRAPGDAGGDHRGHREDQPHGARKR